jgi:predicted amidohydrolase YtcJ
MKFKFQKITAALIILFFVIIITACSKVDHADLVIINGTVATMDDTLTSAQAIAVKGDTIYALGSTNEIKRFIGDSTNVIDAKGSFVMPGFIESHAHLLSLGNSKMRLNLANANTWQDIILTVAQAVDNALPGEWIIGRGWHQEKWDSPPDPNVNGYPYNDELSQASPNNPVLLTHASGHAVLVNARAMELAGITDSTENPPGGEIIRDAQGKAIGVFEETAEDLINSAYNKSLNKKSAQQIKEDKIKAVGLAAKECLSKGITTFHDAGASFQTIDVLKELADSGRLGIRLCEMLGESNDSLESRIGDYKLIGYGNNHLTVRAIKKYIDGALGSRGAWFLMEYADLPGNNGLNVTELKELQTTAQIAYDNGFQLCMHAIGDLGIRQTLNIYEPFAKDNSNLRWRIEHAQHISKSDIPRFAKLNVIAAMQGVHCTSDAIFVPKRLGEYRAKEGAYVWRKLIDSGAIICNGTDAPVEDVDPIKSFYASVTRRLADGTEFYPEQKMTREEALKSYTMNGAYAAFEEKIKGSITNGKLADITILSNNLLKVPDEEILKTQVLYTIVGGKVKYQKIR